MDDLMKKVIESDFGEDELKSKRSSSITVKKCPYCGGLWKLNINGDKGVYRCARCGEAGNAIKLHADLKGLSYNDARIELGQGKLKKLHTFNLSSKDIKIASLERRSDIYKSIIAHGYVSKTQADDLRRRGLNGEELYWYVTCIGGMKNAFKIWCDGENHALIENGSLVGIPGLYGEVFKDDFGEENTSELYLNLPKGVGYFIPVITHGKGNKQEISCMQVRHLKGDLRYSYFTSGDDALKNGSSVSGCNKVHYTRNFWKNGKMVIPKVVNLTEGALKADVASVLSGKPFIAIMGVNNTRDLKEELLFLKTNGCEKINICFDMDYLNNKNVEKALNDVNKIIKNVGLIPNKITWDENYKGIDDYLLSLKENSRL